MTRGQRTPVAVVTGGSGALGRWVVRELLDRGDRVHVPYVKDREVAGLEEVVAPLGEAARDRLTLHRADLSQGEEVGRLFESVRSSGADPGILCNLAGGFAAGAVEETDPSTWERMLATNATTAFQCTRAAVPGMKRIGWGRIVNVAAMPAVQRGGPGMSAYAAAKAAVLSLTYSLSAELVAAGITVNAIVPSIIDTPGNRAAMPDADPSAWLDPRRIAAVVAFLTGESAGIVTGTAVVMTRG